MLLSNTLLLLACEPSTVLLIILVFAGFFVAKRLARADLRLLALFAR